MKPGLHVLRYIGKLKRTSHCLHIICVRASYLWLLCVYIREYVIPCPTPVKFDILRLVGRQKRADKKHDRKVSLNYLVMCTIHLQYVAKYCLPQVNNQQQPRQDYSYLH